MKFTELVMTIIFQRIFPRRGYQYLGCRSAIILCRPGSSIFSSVADPDPNPDPDPPDPHVLGPPGSVSGSTSQRYGSGSKNSKKNLDSYYFVTLFDFLSLKNDINVASKSNKQKNCVEKFVFYWHLEG